MSASLDLARRVLRTEAAAILGLVDRLDGAFDRALQLLQVAVVHPREEQRVGAFGRDAELNVVGHRKTVKSEQ